MNELNKKYILQMEVLTPLHVGAGAEKDWVQGSDFVVHEDKVKILNIKKAAQFVKIDDLTKALLEKNSSSLLTKLAGNLDNCVDTVFNSTYFGTNDIKSCIKNGLSNKPIVPGSSLKGAIRSILVDYLLNDSKTLNEQTLFGKASDGDEFMRFIKVSDAEFKKTNLVNTKIFNLKTTSQGGWKFSGGQNGRTNSLFQSDGFNTFYEVIEPNQKSIMSISIADIAFKNYAEKIAQFSLKKTNLINKEVEFLFEIINAHTKKYLEKEKAFFTKYATDKTPQILADYKKLDVFFTKYATDKTDKIIENINSLINQIPVNGEYCILKMAAGSGFHSITGDWQFDDYSIDKLSYTEEKWGKTKTVSRGMLHDSKSAKSRKIAIQSGDKFSLMGFIKLTPLTDDDIKKAQEEREIQRMKNEMELQVQQQKRVEQERLEQEKIQKEQQLIGDYKLAIQQAEKMCNQSNFEEAKQLIEKAENLLPSELSHYDLKQTIEKLYNNKLLHDKVLEAEKELQDKREAANRVSLEEKLKTSTKIPTVLGNVKTWMKLNGFETIPISDLDALKMKLHEIYSAMKPKEQKDWQNIKKWNELTLLIGDEMVQKWFLEITTTT
ncbi:MAG: RAMP superfamily CRISPR-associated protein [Paludibacter sp.]|nr:RAMP superfamily CRISPR-associated protein [Paludibacter sp.]